MSIPCSLEDDTVLVVSAIDVDVIDGHIYGITAEAVDPIWLADDSIYRLPVLAGVDVLLQMLGVSIVIDFSSDSADFDYSEDTEPFDPVFELSGANWLADEAHTGAIKQFLAVPGAIITTDPPTLRTV